MGHHRGVSQVLSGSRSLQCKPDNQSPRRTGVSGGLKLSGRAEADQDSGAVGPSSAIFSWHYPWQFVPRNRPLVEWGGRPMYQRAAPLAFIVGILLIVSPGEVVAIQEQFP